MPKKVRSEYKSSFRGRVDLEDFYRNVEFRRNRRDCERRHMPLSWNVTSDSSSSTLTDTDEDWMIKKDPLHPVQSFGDNNLTKQQTAMTTNQKSNGYAKDNNHNHRKEIITSSVTSLSLDDVEDMEDGDDNESQPDEVVIERIKKKAVNKALESFREDPQQAGARDDGKTYTISGKEKKSTLKISGRPRHPNLSRPITTTSTATTNGINNNQNGVDKSTRQQHRSVSTRANFKLSSDDKFVSYGLGDRKPSEFGQLQTFNIKSAKHVYPSALRAKEQRKTPIPRSGAGAAGAGGSRSKKSIQKNSKDQNYCDDDESTWRSLYQSSYPSYDASHYERALKQAPLPLHTPRFEENNEKRKQPMPMTRAAAATANNYFVSTA